ncbi:hypothetical protein EOS93_16745 [Rhizobium sp. RMa-01]|uniref:hypothetical protein n=1 Tax=unclassified Rhizobium TaxID=2613769 RepID=UPI000FE10DD6|nr:MULTISPECIES: hypothetical protein [unclassified Rhizobium]RVU09740.1 hypothetical protein EOS93_16745 [Rhizobium sp. RMa-01]
MAYAEKSGLIEKAVVAPRAFVASTAYLLSSNIHVNPSAKDRLHLGPSRSLLTDWRNLVPADHEERSWVGERKS